MIDDGAPDSPPGEEPGAARVQDEADPQPGAPDEVRRRQARKRAQPLGQTIGGVLFGFEQQVFRNQPPPHELVHQARPDAAIPAGNGTMITIGMPDHVALEGQRQPVEPADPPAGDEDATA
jgi:hypothetical protein